MSNNPSNLQKQNSDSQNSQQQQNTNKQQIQQNSQQNNLNQQNNNTNDNNNQYNSIKKQQQQQVVQNNNNNNNSNQTSQQQQQQNNNNIYGNNNNIFQNGQQQQQQYNLFQQQEEEEKQLKEILSVKKESFRVEIRRKITTSQLNNKRFKINNNGSLEVNPQFKQLKQPVRPINLEQLKAFQMLDQQLQEAMGLQQDGIGIVEQLVTEIKNQTLELPIPSKEIFATNLPNKLNQFVKCNVYNPGQLQKISIWTLSNLMCGDISDYQSFVYNSSIIDTVNAILKEGVQDSHTLNSIALLIGNICGEDEQLRSYVIQKTPKFVEKYCHILKYTETNLLMDALWSLKLVIKAPTPSIILEDFDLIAGQLYHYLENPGNQYDDEIMKEVLQIIVSFCELEHDMINIHIALNHNIHTQLIKFLKSDDVSLQLFAIKVVGSFAYGNDYQCQKLIDIGILEVLLDIIKHTNYDNKLEICWVFSNLSAADQNIVEIMKSKNIFTVVAEMIEQERPNIQIECMYTLCNATEKTDIKFINYLVELGLIDFYKQFLVSAVENADFVLEVLESMENVLKIYKEGQGMEIDRILRKIQQIGLSDILQSLQNHENQMVYLKAQDIITSNFQFE